MSVHITDIFVILCSSSLLLRSYKKALLRDCGHSWATIYNELKRSAKQVKAGDEASARTIGIVSLLHTAEEFACGG